MRRVILQTLRAFNKYVIKATQKERIYSEKLVRDKKVKEFIPIESYM